MQDARGEATSGRTMAPRSEGVTVEALLFLLWEARTREQDPWILGFGLGYARIGVLIPDGEFIMNEYMACFSVGSSDGR